MLSFIPRDVAFDKKTGRCVAAGVAAARFWNNPQYENKTMQLPTDHYDFLGEIYPVGWTYQEIVDEIAKYRSYLETVKAEDVYMWSQQPGSKLISVLLHKRPGLQNLAGVWYVKRENVAGTLSPQRFMPDYR